VIGGAESSIRVLSTPGDFVTHRRIPVNDEVAEPAEPSTPVQIRAVYTRDHAKQAWARRRDDLEDSAGIDNFWPRSIPASKNRNDVQPECSHRLRPLRPDQKET